MWDPLKVQVRHLQAAGSRSRTERKRSYVTGEACNAAEAGLSCKGRQMSGEQ